MCAQNIYSESEHDFPDKIAFLDAGHLVGTVLSHGFLPACIVVIPWRRLPEKNISFTNALHYSTIFALPWHRPSHKFAPRRLCLWPKFNAPCEHNTTGSDDTARGVQFIDAGLQPPLLMFNLEITPDVDVDYPDLLGDLYEPLGMTTPLRFVIPGHTLLSHVAALDAATNGRRRMRMVPWCGWGEDTRVWEGAGSGMAVYGSRLFCWERTANWRTKAVIYDFDSPESMVRDIHSGNKTRLNEIVVKPSYLPQTFRRNVQEPMITKAPYRRLETNLEGPGSNRCMLFGENCFVLAETTNHRWVHVHLRYRPMADSCLVDSLPIPYDAAPIGDFTRRFSRIIAVSSSQNINHIKSVTRKMCVISEIKHHVEVFHATKSPFAQVILTMPNIASLLPTYKFH